MYWVTLNQLITRVDRITRDSLDKGHCTITKVFSVQIDSVPGSQITEEYYALVEFILLYQEANTWQKSKKRAPHKYILCYEGEPTVCFLLSNSEAFTHNADYIFHQTVTEDTL